MVRITKEACARTQRRYNIYHGLFGIFGSLLVGSFVALLIGQVTYTPGFEVAVLILVICTSLSICRMGSYGSTIDVCIARNKL